MSPVVTATDKFTNPPAQITELELVIVAEGEGFTVILTVEVLVQPDSITV